ncbi:hypothetical protein D1007_57941 [Hordeum vulgare]|nr:hypothetical protein D1007_57941 [Hordeum vulgare]
MDMECTDVLIDILRHLPPRSLAACRCVCKGWRATVDHHRLLRADLLPLSLDAVIWENDCIGPPMLFRSPLHGALHHQQARLPRRGSRVWDVRRRDKGLLQWPPLDSEQQRGQSCQEAVGAVPPAAVRVLTVWVLRTLLS